MNIKILKHAEKQRLFLIADLRKAIFDFGPRDVREIINASMSTIKSDILIYEAILINSPRDTAIVTLIELGRNHKGFHTKLFIMESSALEWLKLQS